MTDGKIDIPAQLIEAAARVLYDADEAALEPDQRSGRPWEDRSEDGRNAIYGTFARAVLAAAFAESEVTEQWDVDEEGRRFRRVVILGPAVVVTPAQEETANG